ncbi:transcription factor 20 isoform X1 [Hippocampus comes]|uniref:transcription factor 20 isoform X1 n=2 Tax=Hippocampus comes TaxID=109280 RepID=UPI00094ED142|nr:PREDICTED: transcription factor 20 isoform X1 [Hippocampus comes]XP_019726513.1 PREDICTED: transcription factor 20 isoform X1 [Hippocampus comes]XP_019726514.1 PREDICTED: transcription factor 20 isoform X1 [Hippocampus comes]XP_019726515.1 PREDICTED: transcription factor 20 isoform X1 [Hippocampus comes]
MQNFSNSPTPHSLAPGFSMRGGGAPPYPPQTADPQVSPRMTEDYAAMQQQSLHRGQLQSNQASHMLAYNARNRAIVEAPPTQGNLHSGSNNPYRKDTMDYYFSLGGKDKNRRGGLVYGTGFGYPNIDGHIPPQYRHSGAGSVLSSGIMSQYSIDYGPGTGSGGGSGAFSPHQYNMSQNAALQALPSSQSRQHGQTFSPVHHGQQHRSYPSSGHRMTPQYPQYSPQAGAPTGSSGMYSPPPQRYADGTASTGFDPKVNSSHSVNSSANSASGLSAANNMGPVEQRYHASNYAGYIPQTQTLNKDGTLQHCNTQHNLGVGYDNPLKMQHQGPTRGSVYAKHPQASTPSIPPATSQELAKSPLHPQQSQMNQNLSPISNPSPAASAVHSPSCSSTPSPLMGVSETYVNPSVPSHPSSTVHSSSHGHRLIQAASQLSPTPNSNSSISSCGSSGSHKGHNISTARVNSVPPTSCNKTGLGSGLVPREEGPSPSVYSSPPVGKMQDTGVNSLNALSSQVANLPNTIQHMLRTDNVLSQKKGKDGGQVQQATHGVPPLPPRSRNASAASSTGTVKDGTVVGLAEGPCLESVADEDSSYVSAETKIEQEDHLIEGGHTRMRQTSGASSASEPIFYHPPHSQTQPQPGQALNAKTFTYKSPPKVIVSKGNVCPASALASPSECHSSDADPNSHSKPPVSSSTSCIITPPQPNRVSHPSLLNNNSKGSHKKTAEIIKNEQIKIENEDGVEKMEKGNSQILRDGEISTKHGQDKENMLHTASAAHDESDQKPISEEQLSVGVIVSARSEGSQVEKSKQPQDLCLKEKPSQSYLKESSSNNGEEGIDLSRYSSQHPKSNMEQAHNLNQFGSHKYGFGDSSYGSDLSLVKKGRTRPAGVMESSSRNYPQTHSGYGPEHSKELSSLAESFGKRGQAIGPKGQEDISQIQQFPSLLQEVLQGYNLDRRYGRPEQAFPAHLQVQQPFQTRYAYGMTENMRMMEGGASDNLALMGTAGKPQHPNHRLGSKNNFATGLQSSIKMDVSNPKLLQNTAKKEADFSEDHLPAASDAQPIQPKHINLADYSLPQRKTLPSKSTSSSAVQELLLQEPEPLKGCTVQGESQKSERRSVICDVSPNTRSTPEKDRDSNREREKNQNAASVIQQPFSSPASANDMSKKDLLEKKVVKIETVSKEIGPNPDFHGSGGTHDSDMEYSSKSTHSSIVLNADPYRHLPPQSLSANPLSSPSRHQSYLHGADLATSNANSFPGYRFGDTRESNVPHGHSHFPSHHPYHNLSPPAQITNKLQMYPHPRGPFQHSHEINDWVKAMNRSAKDMMMIPVSSPGRHKVSHPEHRQRMIPQADIHSDQHASKTLLHHQGGYYDMKMWESTPPGRDGVRIVDADSCYRTQALPPPSSVPAVSQVPPKAHGPNTTELEETKRPCFPPSCNSTKPQTDVTPAQPQVQRQTKSGGPGETNPLILRRRVRSFISPIPAKRLMQDASQQRAAANSHPTGAHSESNHRNEDESSSSDIPHLSSPLPGDNIFPKSLSPLSGSTKALPPKKGRGLKLEAIVQKISPSVGKPPGIGDDGTNHYPGFTNATMPPFSASQDQDMTHFPRVAGGDDGYIDDTHSLNDMMSFRGVDETGPLPLSGYPCDPQTRKQKDFDFGLGGAVVSASGDKEDFALLGPLPPPPPLPRPVQGSPPPSSSALSDIQHFTNTYQQLETRRGEQSAANLLRQKLQESGMGFDDYAGSDYYGATSPHHSQSQGHVLSRHQMSSPRPNLSIQDCKASDSAVPKGYFPSGKKKGRPVGSVNKQKRLPTQAQTPIQSQVPAQTMNQNSSQPPPTPVSAALIVPDIVQTATSTATCILENKSTPPLTPPTLTQMVKVDVENQLSQPEIEVKPARRRRKGLKDEGGSPERRGRQRIRRAGAPSSQSAAKDNPEMLLGAKGANSINRAFLDPNLKGLFVPHIHVENKIPEIGSVCTIVNAEDDKLKGERSANGGKTGVGAIDSLPPSTLYSQSSKRESELRETDQVETTLQSGKALPSSDYVVSGPAVTETKHSGRQLCCLCQKWANYKHLGDLYGPYYPAEYAAKLPKNQPQLRQCHTTTGATKTAPNPQIGSNALDTLQNLQKQHVPFSRPVATSNCTVNLDLNLKSLSAAVSAPPLTFREDVIGESSAIASSYTANKTPSLSWDVNFDIIPIPELKREPDFDTSQQQQQQLQLPKQPQEQPAEEAQQRPQHRKLTSHPRFKRRHKSSEDSPRMVPSNSKASLPFQPPPPALDSLGPLAQLAQLPQMPMDPEELWVHEGCIVWTSGVYLVNGRLYGLQEALDGARETSCSYCEMVGSTLGCYSKGCIRRYHYLCAIETDCSLNEDNFSLRCPKHKVTQNFRPAKSMYLEQSERGFGQEVGSEMRLGVKTTCAGPGTKRECTISPGI